MPRLRGISRGYSYHSTQFVIICVMKIVSSGKGLHSPEFYKKKQKAKRIKLVVSILAILAFLILVTYFFRWEKFIISEVVIAEEIAVDREEIIEAIKSELGGYYLYVIPKANALIYPRKALRNRLNREFPRFESFDLNLEGMKKLTFSAKERSPFALYCQSSDTCYFLDENGFIFSLAPSFSEGVYFVYKTKNSIESPLGKSILIENDFIGLTKFIKNLPTLGIDFLAIEIGSEDYKLELKSGGEIIWKKETGLGVVYSNLEAFLSDEAIKSQTDFLDKISRLDLRTENKVFYKFK